MLYAPRYAEMSLTVESFKRAYGLKPMDIPEVPEEELELCIPKRIARDALYFQLERLDDTSELWDEKDYDTSQRFESIGQSVFELQEVADTSMTVIGEVTKQRMTARIGDRIYDVKEVGEELQLCI